MGSLIPIETVKDISVVLGLCAGRREMGVDTQRPVHQIHAFLNLLVPGLDTTDTIAKGLFLPVKDGQG